MSLVETRRNQLFPVLTRAQIETARRFAPEPPRCFAPDAVLFARGEQSAPAWLVMSGAIVIGEGTAEIARHGPGEMTGEVSQLSGRPAIAQGRAGEAGCEALAFDAAHLRALLIGSAELGELLMRAFILRRTVLIAEGGAGSVLVGHPQSPALARLEGFLTRNAYPYTVLDSEADGAEMRHRLGLAEPDLPVLVTPAGTVLRHPDEARAGLALGITPKLDPERVFDVAVVGAGPAGLATAVYAASEGLSVVVVEARAFGGQAGASARIENYLGFPTGITGQSLMARAFTQAQKFGAEIAVPLCVAHLACGGADRPRDQPFELAIAGGATVRARTVVIASGARYRRPAIANLDQFEGAGVSYWASPVEARLCAGEEVALVGAGNSAGQAVAFLAPRVKHLHLVVRGDGLGTSMSRYLIDRIAALANVTVHVRTEIIGLAGDAERGLQSATFKRRDSDQTWEHALHHVFLFIGADPNTAWLDGCAVATDANGFVITGAGDRGALETNVAGVFAIGDVRAGSTKRVAAAVGEGAAVVAALHAMLPR